jgi:hypothetical protein
MRAFLYWFTGRLPCRIICDGDSPYLERYYLWTVFGTHWYLHRFVASDPDRGYHDQPVALGILHPARRLVLGGDCAADRTACAGSTRCPLRLEVFQLRSDAPD